MPLGEAEPHSQALSTNTLRQWWKSSVSSTMHAFHWVSVNTDGPLRAEWKPPGAGRVKPQEVVFLRATRLNVNSFITFGLKCPIWIFSHPSVPYPIKAIFSLPFLPSLLCTCFSESLSLALIFVMGRVFFFPQTKIFRPQISLLFIRDGYLPPRCNPTLFPHPQPESCLSSCLKRQGPIVFCSSVSLSSCSSQDVMGWPDKHWRQQHLRMWPLENLPLVHFYLKTFRKCKMTCKKSFFPFNTSAGWGSAPVVRV